MERVSVLLGHSSIKVTEKYYAPWVRARQPIRALMARPREPSEWVGIIPDVLRSAP
jgi:integrase